MLNILYSFIPTDPPEMPTISGYTEGREVYAENILSMTCTCVGGNPPATLTWWKGKRLQKGNLFSICISDSYM